MRKFISIRSGAGIILPFLLVLFISRVFAQIPPGYYDPSSGKTGVALQAALHTIIKGHTVISYAGLWTAYYTTDDKPNGKGLFKWPDGSSYEGDFTDGKRSGKGIFRFPNGEFYEGDFMDGSFTGFGILYDAAGNILKQGLWDNDKFVGLGKT